MTETVEGGPVMFYGSRALKRIGLFPHGLHHLCDRTGDDSSPRASHGIGTDR